MRNIFICLLFAAVFFVGDRGLSFIAHQLSRLSTMPISQLYAREGKADILILGNSRGYRHFDEAYLAQKTGLTVRNYAMVGASISLMNVLLSDYVRIYGPPRIAIIEVSGLSGLDNYRQVVAHRWFAHHSDAYANLLHTASPTHYWAGHAVHLTAYNSETFLNTLHKIIRPYRQVISEREMQDSAIVSEPMAYFTIKELERTAFEQMIALAAEHEIELLLVLSPVYERQLAYFTQVDQFRKTVQTIAHTAEHVVFFDASTLDIPVTAFSDAVHMNRIGVRLFLDTLFRQRPEDGPNTMTATFGQRLIPTKRIAPNP